MVLGGKDLDRWGILFKYFQVLIICLVLAPMSALGAAKNNSVFSKVKADNEYGALIETIDWVSRKMAKNGARVGIEIRALDSGAIIARKNAGFLLNPASNVKLITSAAALHVLKPEYRFKTEYFIHGELKAGVLDGDIVVKGYGDPSIVSERLSTVATELRLRGIKKVNGSIVIDASHFDNVLEAKGYEFEKQRYRAYAAPVSAVSFNHNSISLFLRPTKRGDAAFVAVDPPVSYVQLKGSIQTVGRRRGEANVITFPSKNKTILSVWGKTKESASSRRIYRRIYDPSRYFASAMRYYLKREGIEIEQEAKTGSVAQTDKLIYVDWSEPLSKIISDLNKFSNNFIAEMLVKALGATISIPGTFDAGLEVIRTFLANEVGLKAGTYVMGNGSGLNHVNQFSAKQIVDLLAYLEKDFEKSAEFISSLSVAGTQGTIASRMQNSTTARRVRAKTGTLTGVSALSGYAVTSGGKVLAFSILIEGHSLPSHKVWRIQDKIAYELALLGKPNQARLAKTKEGSVEN